jgi:hypothetical protein
MQARHSCIVVLLLGLMSGASFAGTLEDVQSAGILQCGVDGLLPHYSAVKTADGVVGLAPDFCRALAAALIGDGKKVNFSVLTEGEEVEALQSGEVDEQRKVFGAFVRQGDDPWLLHVQSVRSFLIRAEISDQETLVLGDVDVTVRTLAAAGHYGDMFIRSFGAASLRGKNVPLTQGGWLWAADP